jgi:hypothetical protein
MKRINYDHSAEPKLIALFLIDRLDVSHFEVIKRKVFEILEIDHINLARRSQIGFKVEKSLFDHRDEYLQLFRSMRDLHSKQDIVIEILDTYIFGIENGIIEILDSIVNFLVRVIYTDRSDHKILNFNRDVSRMIGANSLFENDFYKVLIDIIEKFNIKIALDLSGDHVFLRIQEQIRGFRVLTNFVSSDLIRFSNSRVNEESWKFLFNKILYSYSKSQDIENLEFKKISLLDLNQGAFFKFVDNKTSLFVGNYKDFGRNNIFDFALALSDPFHENPKHLLPNDMRYNSLPINEFFKQSFWRTGQSFPYENSVNDWLQIEKILNHLTDDGILLYIIPTKALTSQLRKSFREQFLKRDLLRIVIELPNGYFKYSNIDVSALIVTKKGTGMHLLSFNESGYIENSLDEIFDGLFLNDRKSSSNKNLKFYSRLDLKDLEALNYEVSPELVYFKRTRTIENVISLGDTLDSKEKNKPMFRGVSISSNYWVPKDTISEPEYAPYYVQANNILDHGIDFDNLIILNEENYKYSRYELKHGDFIITARTTHIKTIVVELVNRSVSYVASGTMIVIRLDKDKLDPYFLKAYLDSELGKHQIKSITKKQMSNLNLLTINDLKQLKIPKLSIHEQQRIAKTYKEKVREINSAKKILDIANEDYSLTFNELFSEYGS